MLDSPNLSLLTLPLWALLAWGLVTLVLAAWIPVLMMRVRYRIRVTQLECEAELAESKSALDFTKARIAAVENDKIGLQTELNEMRNKLSELRSELSSTHVRWEQKEVGLQAEIASLIAAREGLTKEFENLANRLFDAKQEQFSRASQSQLQQLIAPFRDQLKDFRSKVEEVQMQDSARHHQLMGQIVELQKQSQQIGQDAVNLANALKGNNKVMGNWGELILANLLENMGLQKSRDFDVQVSEKTESGQRLQPDVVVYLPDEKDLIIDAKVSLLAFEKFHSATEESLKSQALKDHLESIRAHIRELSGKNYAEFIGRKHLDFVCMFVPVEAAFTLAIQHQPELLQEAYDKRIIIVSPSSLFVILRSVNALWQRDRQDRNVEQIVLSAGKLHDQFVRFLESMQEVGNGIERASRSFELAMSRLSSGKGNLIKRSDDLRKLGAKTSKLVPSGLLEAAQANQNDFEGDQHD